MLRSRRFLGANSGVAEVLVEGALCELEGEGDVVETALLNLDVATVQGHALCKGDLCLNLTGIVKSDFPVVTGCEFEFTVLGKCLILEGEGSTGVGEGLGLRIGGGEAPAVHTAANTEVAGIQEDDLCILEVLVLVDIKDDVIQTGLLNLHCNGSLTNDEFALQNLCRVI